MTVLSGSYDYKLVALSFAIAIVTSYAAVDLAARVTANRRAARFAWLLGGAIAMGIGTWCMHYTGMLAFHLPVTVAYHIPTVILSLLTSVLASLVALYVVSREEMTSTHVIWGSILMGSGIAVMHYSGMAAMRCAAMHHYNYRIVTLSFLLAIVISYIGLLLLYLSRDESGRWWIKPTVALLLGLAIPVMHYTGMAAVSFMPSAAPVNLSNSLDTSILADRAILCAAFLIAAFVILTSYVDRQLSTQKLLLHNERYLLRALIDNVPDFVYVKDTQSRFVLANPMVLRSMGVDKLERLKGKTDFDFYPREVAAAYFEDEQNIIRTKQSIFGHEEVVISSAGEQLHFITTKVPLFDNKGNVTGIAGIGHDISKHKRAEKALREAVRKYHSIFDEAIVGIFQTAPNGAFLSANPAMADILGFKSPEEMLASCKNLGDIFINPQRYIEYQSQLKMKGSLRNFEYEAIHQNGKRIWIALSVRAVIEFETSLRYDGMSQDITERKLLESQLLQAQKLESVGQLAAGIAHEINTPTQYIGDNLQFLRDSFISINRLLDSYNNLLTNAEQKTLEPNHIEEVRSLEEAIDRDFLAIEIPKAFEQTIEGIERISSLVGAMKEFSHPGTKDKIRIDLNQSIQSTIAIARPEWKHVANVETDLDPLLPLILCQPGEFNQVILNLIVNASHAIGDAPPRINSDKGTIRIKTLHCKPWVEIQISDNGIGIPEEIRSRIFDPFFTTKEIGRGTGQGLAIARSIITDHHKGTIHFDTRLGEGTTFILRLPIDGKA